jgi:hypothetical protein
MATTSRCRLARRLARNAARVTVYLVRWCVQGFNLCSVAGAEASSIRNVTLADFRRVDAALRCEPDAKTLPR